MKKLFDFHPNYVFFLKNFMSGFSSMKSNFFLFLVPLIFSACTEVPKGDIQQRYTETVRKLGIIPVYPPREEFQIGDVFVASFGVDQDGDAVDVDDTARIWVADLPEVAVAADEFMKSRIVFQPTKTSGTTSDLFGDKLKRRKDLRIESLPISAFPTISGDAGFTSALGITRALQAIGIGGGTRTQVRLEFDDVRTYWVEPIVLDQTSIRNKLVKDTLIPNQFKEPSNPIFNNLERKEAIERNSGRRLREERCTAAIVVTRVYVTRKINFTYYNADIIAAGIRRAEEGSTLSAVPAPQRVSVTINNTTGEPVTAGSTDDELAALRSQIDALATNDAEGRGLNFETWNALGITFSKEYKRPVAVGYEGFSFPVDIRKNAKEQGYSKCS